MKNFFVIFYRQQVHNLLEFIGDNLKKDIKFMYRVLSFELENKQQFPKEFNKEINLCFKAISKNKNTSLTLTIL